ncbi:MAG TPA: hypothetical protein VGM19_09325 [Armatimonadota bacterium]
MPIVGPNTFSGGLAKWAWIASPRPIRIEVIDNSLRLGSATRTAMVEKLIAPISVMTMMAWLIHDVDPAVDATGWALTLSWPHELVVGAPGYEYNATLTQNASRTLSERVGMGFAGEVLRRFCGGHNWEVIPSGSKKTPDCKCDITTGNPRRIRFECKGTSRHDEQNQQLADALDQLGKLSVFSGQAPGVKDMPGRQRSRRNYAFSTLIPRTGGPHSALVRIVDPEAPVPAPWPERQLALLDYGLSLSLLGLRDVGADLLIAGHWARRGATPTGEGITLSEPPREFAERPWEPPGPPDAFLERLRFYLADLPTVLLDGRKYYVSTEVHHLDSLPIRVALSHSGVMAAARYGLTADRGGDSPQRRTLLGIEQLHREHPVLLGHTAFSGLGPAGIALLAGYDQELSDPGRRSWPEPLLPEDFSF